MYKRRHHFDHIRLVFLPCCAIRLIRVTQWPLQAFQILSEHVISRAVLWKAHYTSLWLTFHSEPGALEENLLCSLKFPAVLGALVPNTKLVMRQ